MIHDLLSSLFYGLVTPIGTISVTVHDIVQSDLQWCKNRLVFVNLQYT